MGSLYVKGSKIWARYKDERGQWKGGPTPYRPGDDARARGFLKRLENQIAAKRSYGDEAAEEAKGPITVARYADRWVADRQKLGLATATDDLARLRLHVLPTLGTMVMEQVRPRHIRDLVLEMRQRAVMVVSPFVWKLKMAHSPGCSADPAPRRAAPEECAHGETYQEPASRRT